MTSDTEKHSDSILRVCSYHRLDYDLAVIRTRPHEMDVVQGSLQTAFQTTPATDLSILSRLPPELVSLILYELDILSYFKFRQVSRRARMLSTALQEYKLVAKYGLEGLRGLIRAELGRNFTIVDLCRSLITSSCTLCGAFGGFLFLLTATRCCFDCIKRSPKLRVLPPSTFAKLARISIPRLNRVVGPNLRTVPGRYGIFDASTRVPKYLLCEEDAITTLTLLAILDQYSVQAIPGRFDRGGHRLMASTAFPAYDLRTKKAEYGVSCKGCHIRLSTPRGKTEDRDRVFSTADFLTHFPDCAEAQSLWAESQNGTVSVRDPDFIVNGGYINRLDINGIPL